MENAIDFLWYARFLTWIVIGILALAFIVRIIQFIIYIRKNRKEIDYQNNKPESVAWWKVSLAFIFSFLWFVFITKNKDVNGNNS